MRLVAVESSAVAKKTLPPTKYSFKQIQAVAQFQNYGGSHTAAKDIAMMFDKTLWDAKFRKAGVTLYRVVGIKKKDFESLMTKGTLPAKKASSWTKSLKIAKDFVHEFWFSELNDDPTTIAVILQLDYKGQCLDIDALHKDKEFTATIEYYHDKRKFFNEGIDIGDAQKEVALPALVTKKKDVISFFDRDKGKFVPISKWSGE